MSEDSEKSAANHKKWMATMEALTDVSLKMTEACLEKTEANQGKVEIMTEVCIDEINVEPMGHWRTDLGTGVWL
jgi:hypothetical protein